jgi:diguanylate cyclase (GGDEF)-like protein/PAS domain S-box-containing protein
MLRLGNLGISIKVLMAPAAVMVALVVTAYVALEGARTQELAMLRLQQDVERPMNQAVELRDAAGSFQSRAYALISTSGNETDANRLMVEAQSLLQRIPHLTNAATALQTKLESLPAYHGEHALIEALSAYSQAAHDTVDMLGTMPAYSAIMMNETEQRFTVLRGHLDALIDRMAATRLEISSTFADNSARARNTLIAALIVAGTLGSLVALFVSWMIARPIRSLTRAMRSIAAGDLTVDVAPICARSDEIGAMASAVRVFVDGLHEAQQLHHEQETARAREAARLRRFANATFEGILIHRERKILDVNAALATMLGYDDLDDLRGRDLGSVMAAESVDIRSPPGNLGSSLETRALRRDGSTVPVEMLARPVEFDGGEAVVVALRDLTEREEAANRIKHLAYHDALTGLPNRLLFNDRCKQALEIALRFNKSAAILSLDLDRFKFANDVLGHEGGDQLLKLVAERILSAVRTMDTVARLGGDEFVVLLPLEANAEIAATVSQRIIDLVLQPFEINGQKVGIGVSVGIAIAPADGGSAEDLLKSSDLALYKAKHEGRGRYHFFEKSLEARDNLRRIVEQDLQRAIERQELALTYQPLYNCRTGKIESLEALMIWNHATRGRMAASEFIPIAEETGLISKIGLWSLETACAHAATWDQPYSVSVNLSPAQLSQIDLGDVILDILCRTNLPPQRLELEVTESLLIGDAEKALCLLKRMRREGIEISLDDFGTGYSSLSYLTRFPFSKLKVDKSFIWNLDRTPEDAEIVRAILAMARALHLRVTAEGVETEAQLKFLQQANCDQVQGYLLSRPVPAEAVNQLATSFAIRRARHKDREASTALA